MIPPNSFELPFYYSRFVYNLHKEKELKAFYNEEKNLFFLEFTPDKTVEGPPNHVHGGYLASILDEAMGAIMFLSGYFGMTQHFEITYKKPVPLYKTHYIQSNLEKLEKRKIYVEAKVFSDDIIYTTATAIFLQFDFHKLGITPEYKLLLEFQKLKQSGISIQESLQRLKESMQT